MNNSYYMNDDSDEEDEEEENFFICEEDGMKFPSEKAYLCHYNEEHPNLYPFYCRNCNKGFNSENGLLSHEKNSMKHKRKINVSNAFCYICKRKFGNKFALKSHIYKERHFQCNICGRIFLSRFAIESHCRDKNH